MLIIDMAMRLGKSPGILVSSAISFESCEEINKTRSANKHSLFLKLLQLRRVRASYHSLVLLDVESPLIHEVLLRFRVGLRLSGLLEGLRRRSLLLGRPLGGELHGNLQNTGTTASLTRLGQFRVGVHVLKHGALT